MKTNVCPRCGNTEERYFYTGFKGRYCRLCARWQRVLLDEEETNDLPPGLPLDGDYQLGFHLSEGQKEASKALLGKIQESDTLLYAACGAGKTEIALESVAFFLKQGLRVCWAIPRRQVVLQLCARLGEYFKHLKVIGVCGGHTSDLTGDLIVCTTHQLWRWHKAFDLLVLDEPDAFPYHGNTLLQGILKSSCRGKILYLSATPDEDLLKLPQVRLFKRPWGVPLCVPRVLIKGRVMLFMQLVAWICRHPRTLVFVPSVRLARRLGLLLGLPIIHAGSKDKEQLIQAFLNRQINQLITTTVLERGVTFEELDVLVYQADHPVFSAASLVQILGRVGRSPRFPDGKGMLLCRGKSEEVKTCLAILEEMNA